MGKELMKAIKGLSDAGIPFTVKNNRMTIDNDWLFLEAFQPVGEETLTVRIVDDIGTDEIDEGLTAEVLVNGVVGYLNEV